MCTQPQQRSRGGEYAERELIQRLPGNGKARGSTGTVHASHPQKAPRKAPTSQASWPLAYDPASGRSRAKVVQEKVMKKLVCGRKKPYYKKTFHSQMLLALRRRSLQICQPKSSHPTKKTTLPNGPHVVCQIWKHAAGSHTCLIQAIQYPNKRALKKKIFQQIRELHNGSKISEYMAPVKCSCATTSSSQAQAPRPSTWTGCTCDT